MRGEGDCVRVYTTLAVVPWSDLKSGQIRGEGRGGEGDGGERGERKGRVRVGWGRKRSGSG